MMGDICMGHPGGHWATITPPYTQRWCADCECVGTERRLYLQSCRIRGMLQIAVNYAEQSIINVWKIFALTEEQHMGEEEMSPAGTGPVGSEHYQNLRQNMASCWDPVVCWHCSWGLSLHCPYLVYEDDSHADGGDDQHRDHPDLVLGWQGPAHLLDLLGVHRVGGNVSRWLIKLITDALTAAGNDLWLVSWFGESWTSSEWRGEIRTNQT